MKNNQSVKKASKNSLLVVAEPVVVRGIAADIVNILNHDLGTDGLTVGQIHERYVAKFPLTGRSRNELAKRVSELSEAGILAWAGRVNCPTTGRKASKYVTKDGNYTVVTDDEKIDDLAEAVRDVFSAPNNVTERRSLINDAFITAHTGSVVDPKMTEKAVVAFTVVSYRPELHSIEAILIRYSKAWFLTKSFKGHLARFARAVAAIIDASNKL